MFLVPFSNRVFIFVHLRCILLSFVQPLKVRGFTRLSKKQLCFTSSSSFSLLPGDISRISGRDPLLVWESCDARRPTSQKIPEIPDVPGSPVCFFCAFVI